MKKKNDSKKWFYIISIILFLFFLFNFFHSWANNLPIKLHFCNHAACMVYSIIWLVIGILIYREKNTKKIKNLLIISFVILIIGIILMNLISCDTTGKMSFGTLSAGMKDCTLGVDCPNETVTVPNPPCRETDAGRDYITPGMIMSGADLADRCMSSDILRERYCNSVTTYTSEDISCSRYMTNYVCLSGECVYRDLGINETEGEEEGEEHEINCGDGLDNDGDGLIDCADSDCDFAFEDGGCEDFDYSCEHISPYPTCGGTCPTEERCEYYSVGLGGWCACIPEDETICGDSYPTCGGWCEENYACLPTTKGCTCEFTGVGDCYESDETDNPFIGGYCYDFNTEEITYDECQNSLVLFEQKCVENYGCDTYAIICQNDSDYGLYPEMGYSCFDTPEGDICGSY